QTCPKGRSKPGAVALSAPPVASPPEPMASAAIEPTASAAIEQEPAEAPPPQLPGRVSIQIIAQMWHERVARLEEGAALCPATPDRSTVLMELANVKAVASQVFERAALIEKVLGKLMSSLQRR